MWQSHHFFLALRSGYKLLKMQKNKIQMVSLPEVFSVQAELWSADKKQVFRITFYDFENETEDWIVIKVEYQTAFNSYQKLHWEFDFNSLIRAYQALESFDGTKIAEQFILSAPFQNETLAIKYRPGYLEKPYRKRGKMNYPSFGSRFEGLILNRKFSGFGFEFKVTQIEIFEFHKEIARAARMFSKQIKLRVVSVF